MRARSFLFSTALAAFFCISALAGTTRYYNVTNPSETAATDLHVTVRGTATTATAGGFPTVQGTSPSFDFSGAPGVTGNGSTVVTLENIFDTVNIDSWYWTYAEQQPSATEYAIQFSTTDLGGGVSEVVLSNPNSFALSFSNLTATGDATLLGGNNGTVPANGSLAILSFATGTGHTITLVEDRLSSENTQSYPGAGTLDYQISAIPEPGTWLLMAAGVSGLVALRRRATRR